MPFQDFTQSEEDQLQQELDAAQNRINAIKVTSGPTLAENVAYFYRQYPDANLGTIIPAARAFTDGVMNSEQASEFLKAVVMRELKEASRAYVEKKKQQADKSWFERNVSDKFKTAARYALSGVEAVPQFAQNLGSRAISEVIGMTATVRDVATTGTPNIGVIPPTPSSQFQYEASTIFGGGPGFDYKRPEGGFFEGSFIATDLGTLLANDEVAGEGFFLGGRARELQAERARRYRGEIDGHAFTIGRGLTSFVAQPGSDTYNNLSGFIDAAAAILTPSAPGLKTVKPLVAGKSANILGMRSLAGIVDAESASFDPRKVANFLTSRSGRKVVDRMINIKNVDEAMEIFSGTTDAKFLLDVVDIAERSRLAKTAGNANYADEMQMFFRDTFGLQDITRGIAPMSVDSINISRFDDLRRGAWMVGSQRESKVARLMAKQYTGDVFVAGGSQREVMMSIRNVKEMLRAVKVDPLDRARLVNNFTRALVENNGEIGKVVNEFNDILRTQFKALNVGDELTDRLIEGIGKARVTYKDRLYGFIDGEGLEYSFADKGAKFITMDGRVFDAPLATAGLQSEMLKHSLILPDAARVRRIASRYSVISAITTKQKFTRGIRNEAAERFEFLNDATKYGELRIPFAALEFIQNQVWRPLTLMTGGYILRNMFDSGLRAAYAPQLQTDVFHPFQHLLAMSHKRYRGDIEGLLFEADFEDMVRAGHTEYGKAINAEIREKMDSRVRYAHERATGVWKDVKIGDGINEFSEGVMAEIALLGTDDLVSRIARGDTDDELLDWLRRDPKGKEYAKSLQSRWANVEAVDSTTKQREVVSFKFIDPTTGDIDETMFSRWINDYARNRISATTGDNSILTDIIASNRFLDSSGRQRYAFELSADGTVTGFTKAFRKQVKEIIKDPTNRLKETYKHQVYVKARGGVGGLRDDVLQSWDRAVEVFFGTLYGKPEAYLNRSPAFRQFYYQQVGRFLDELAPGEAKNIVNQIKFSARSQVERELKDLQKLASKHASLTAAGKPADVFYNGRKVSPQRIQELITKKQDEIAEIINKMADPAKELAYISRYVGDGKLAQKIIGKANGSIPSNGKITLEELSQLAKGYALDETQKLFYNVSNRSNFADVFRVIAPFGSAWYEVSKTWGKQLAKNPEVLKKASVTVQGLRDYDPDNDGKGFFWRDPTTGEYVFNYPWSVELAPFFPAAVLGTVGAFAGGALAGPPGLVAGAVAGAGAGMAASQALPAQFGAGGPLEGLDVQMVAPVRSLSMGLNYLPGVGPYVQFPASKVLENKPDLDWLSKIVAPYGEPDLAFVTGPAWAKKMHEAFFGNPESDRLLGDTTIDVMRVLAASGKYDLTTEDGKLELENDAISQARYLLTIRAMGQFLGPARPKIDYVVDTKQSDKMASELSKAVYDMKDADFDGYVQTFMETFGDDFYLYFASKSRSVAGGLDASKDFGNWERGNQTLFRKYPEVAGYFAPEVGSKFDYQVFIRQIENNKLRIKTRPSEIVDIAQNIVGTAMYKYARKKFGDTLDADEKEQLSDIRKEIEKRYPGFKTAPMDVKKYENRIELARDAALNASELEGNPVAEAAREYFLFRDEMLRLAELRGYSLGAGKNEDLRGKLFAFGETLAVQIPEFGRMWDLLLVDEVIE